MIVEDCLTIFGMKIRVCRSRRAGGYSAELEFEGGDRAVIDACSLDELESLIEAVAYPAAVARRARESAPGLGWS